MRFCLILIGVCFIMTSRATIIEQALWINNGVSNIVDSPEIPYTAFNPSTEFETLNAILTVSIGDTIAFIIHNNDSLMHGFNIKNVTVPGGPYTIAPGDFITVDVPFENYGAYIYYDDYNYPHFKSLGAAGTIMVGNTEHPLFYWNMKEHDKTWNVATTEGVYGPIEDYAPLYFTINGLSNPETQDDPLSRITGNVGDTLVVCIANTGQMTHSIHFHGYHATITYSSANPGHIHRIKDTFPVQEMETILVYLVPDKIGKYPVHDHNLVATSGNGIYANGMFHIIDIVE
ncbi:MAG: multicopper oxidase domain-containing protein [Crocinitomix sp.]|nr:multicopper oxidase domain-containing protein [Crocinitomix sp.]